MVTCEKCGMDYPQIEATMIETKAKQRRRAAICVPCWDTIHPGEWFKLPIPGDEEETEEVTRMYWECDFCANIFKAAGVQVLVRAEQAPPKTEYIVCGACAKTHPELIPKPAQEPLPAAIQAEPEVLAEKAQAEPEAGAEQEEQAQASEPEKAQAGPALATPAETQEEPEEASAVPATQQSGWQAVAQVVEKVETIVTAAITTATDAYKKLTSDQK
jgi:hypothetical protein